jgi:hypothetical protein
MTDFYLPQDLRLAKATLSLDANTAGFSSPTVGSTRTTERLGDRLRINFDFTAHRDDAVTARQRGRMQAFLKKLRGQANRVYMSPPGAVLRGSFPAPELVPNNTFANGTTGWNAFNASCVLSAQDRTLRSKRIAPFAGYGASTPVTLALNIPYTVRAMVIAGAGLSSFRLNIVASSWFVDVPFVGGNYCAFSAVPDIVASPGMALYETTATGGIAGDFLDIPWASVSRCALVDNGANLLLWSDDYTNAAWTKVACTINANAFTAADGTLTADAIVDTAVNTAHDIQQSCACSAAAQDITGYATLENSAKAWAFLQIYTATGACSVYANLSTGAMGTVTTGTGWLNARATMANVGGNKYRLSVTGYKTSADTTVTLAVGPAASDLNTSYVGAATQATSVWRAGIALSSNATIGAKTVGAAQAAVGQTGTLLRLKGLPVSTAGLLLSGDWIECNNQLNQVVASLDSDAAGLGVVQLARPFRNSPADGAPFIVNNPMGKFMVSSNTTSWNEQPGGLSDATIEFAEDISF